IGSGPILWSPTICWQELVRIPFIVRVTESQAVGVAGETETPLTVDKETTAVPARNSTEVSMKTHAKMRRGRGRERWVRSRGNMAAKHSCPAARGGRRRRLRLVASISTSVLLAGEKIQPARQGRRGLDHGVASRC